MDPGDLYEPGICELRGMAWWPDKELTTLRAVLQKWCSPRVWMGRERVHGSRGRRCGGVGRLSSESEKSHLVTARQAEALQRARGGLSVRS